jgi:hypothetical protein
MIRLLLWMILMVSVGGPELLAQPVDFLLADTANQDKVYPRYFTLDFKVQRGRHVTTGVRILEQTIEQNPYSVFESRFGIKGYGQESWHQIFRYPTYGIGIYQAFFIPQNNQLGNPGALYLFFNQPLLGNERIYFGYDLAFGLSYNFLNYDPDHNPDQLAIGTAQNIIFQIEAETGFRIAKRLDGSVGFGFTHFSNGRMRTPQRGVNLYHLSGRLRYHMGALYRKNDLKKDWPKVRPKAIRHVLPAFAPRWEFYLCPSAGVATPEGEHLYVDRSIHYFIASIDLSTAYHYAYFGKIGLGVDFFYDETLNEWRGTTYTSLPFDERLWWGAHVGHEFMVQRFRLVTHFGITLSQREYKGRWYSRVGLRYDFAKNFYIRGVLKTPEGFKADFIEWGIGYSLYKIRKSPATRETLYLGY